MINQTEILKAIAKIYFDGHFKFYRLEEGKICRYDLVKMQYCMYNRDEYNNLGPMREDFPDIESVVKRRNLSGTGSQKEQTITKNTLGKDWFITKEDLLEYLNKNAE